MFSINFNKDEFEKLIRKVVQEELGTAQDYKNKASQKPCYTNNEMLELLHVNSKTLKNTVIMDGLVIAKLAINSFTQPMT